MLLAVRALSLSVSLSPQVGVRFTPLLSPCTELALCPTHSSFHPAEPKRHAGAAVFLKGLRNQPDTKMRQRANQITLEPVLRTYK